MSRSNLPNLSGSVRQEADRLDWSLPVLDPRWLTTADAARMLERCPRLVRWMAQTGRLSHQTTQSGQYLFLKRDVDQVVQQRATARFRGVYVGRPKRARIVPGDPRQLSLFRPWLQLVAGGLQKEMIAGPGNRARAFAQGIGPSPITVLSLTRVRAEAAERHTARRRS